MRHGVESRLPREMPGKDDVLVVAEACFWKQILEMEKKRQPTGGGSGRTIWRLEVGESCERPEAGMATVEDLFQSVVGLECLSPRDVVSEGGERHLAVKQVPLALWPLFGRIIVQCDWRLGCTQREDGTPFDPVKDWWQPDREHLKAEHKVWLDHMEAPLYKGWASKAVVPAGLLLLNMIRHEYSIDERTELWCLTDAPSTDSAGNSKRLTTFGAMRKSLDSNGRIRCGDLAPEGPDRALVPVEPSKKWKEASPTSGAFVGSEWLERLLRARLARSMWKELGALQSVADAKECPVVVFCDDNPKNVTGFLQGVGLPCDLGGEDKRCLRCARIPQTSKAMHDINEKPDKWDEAISDLVRNPDGPNPLGRDCSADPPIFVLCDYDLDSAGTNGGGVSDGAVPVTGAKLAALVKGHLSKSYRGRSISAIAFTGGASPVIAQECIGLGCDFVIRKDGAISRGGSGAHVSVDVGGLSSLTLWIWTISCHHRFLLRVREELSGDTTPPERASELVEAAFRAVVRRELSVPRSLEARLNEVRAAAMSALAPGMSRARSVSP